MATVRREENKSTNPTVLGGQLMGDSGMKRSEMTPERLENRRTAARLRYHARHKDHVKDKNLQNHYGITLGDLQTMLHQQEGVCAICQSGDWGKYGPMVDHDHATGLIRGILCTRCNVALGMMKDDPKLLMSAIHYLTAHQEVQPSQL